MHFAKYLSIFLIFFVSINASAKDAKNWLAKEGYDSLFGARPLRRAIQKFIETPIAKGIISGKFIDGNTIKISVKKKLLSIEKSRD